MSKIRPGELLALIASEAYNVQDTLTICVLTLHSGFKVVGKSTCIYVADFNAETGRRLARDDAIEQLWALEGYARLRDQCKPPSDELEGILAVAEDVLKELRDIKVHNPSQRRFGEPGPDGLPINTRQPAAQADERDAYIKAFNERHAAGVSRADFAAAMRDRGHGQEQLNPVSAEQQRTQNWPEPTDSTDLG